jgi:hypothetical protein
LGASTALGGEPETVTGPQLGVLLKAARSHRWQRIGTLSTLIATERAFPEQVHVATLALLDDPERLKVKTAFVARPTVGHSYYSICLPWVVLVYCLDALASDRHPLGLRDQLVNRECRIPYFLKVFLHMGHDVFVSRGPPHFHDIVGREGKSDA